MAEKLRSELKGFKVGDLVQINVGSPSDPVWTNVAVIISFESFNMIRVQYRDPFEGEGNYYSWRLRRYQVKFKTDSKLVNWLRS